MTERERELIESVINNLERVMNAPTKGQLEFAITVSLEYLKQSLRVSLPDTLGDET